MIVSVGGTLDYKNSAEITSDHFGTVVKIGETNNAKLMEQGTHFDLSMDYLNIGSIRYPGGTEGVKLFDIGNPIHIAGLKNAIDYCAEEGLKLNFTLSDLKYFYNTKGEIIISDSNESELRNFIENDLISYARSKGVIIESIRIGNEFLGNLVTSEGSFLGESASGYGKNAAALVNLLDSVLDGMNLSERSIWRPDIVVESAGWVRGANTVINQLIKYGAADNIDAIDLHGAHNGDDGIPSLNMTWDQFYGTALSDEPGRTYADRLQEIIDVWQGNRAVDHVALRMDAWAFPTDTLAGTALINAGLGIVQMHTLSSLGFTSATNYISYGWDNSSLMLKANPNKPNFIVEDRTTAAGIVFKMLATSVEGKSAVALTSAPSTIDEADDPLVLRAFEGNGELILYVISRVAKIQNIELSLNNLLRQSDLFFSGATITDISLIGLESAGDVSDRRSIPDVTSLDMVSLMDGSTALDFSLAGYEIAQITVSGSGYFGTSNDDILKVRTRSGILHGVDGDDQLTGSIDNDTLSGGNGRDAIFGGSGDDVILGGENSDRINGGAGYDTVTFLLETTGIQLNLGRSTSSSGSARGDTYTNVERFIGSRFADTLIGGSSGLNLDGSGGHDILTGGRGADTLFGGTGNDTLASGMSNDSLEGGSGFDRLSGMDGDDSLLGGDEGDTLNGDNGNDVLFGGYGWDSIVGGHGNDAIYGGIGEDTVHGDTGSDTLFGDQSSDYVYGGMGNDIVFGGNGNDRVWGGDGRDTLYGGAGDDIIRPSSGFDFLYGGEGADVFQFLSIKDLSRSLAVTDTILDFEKGSDKIDLSSIDASTLLKGNNEFIFSGTNDFGTSRAGEIGFFLVGHEGESADYTVVRIDTDKDADFEALIVLPGLHSLTSSDFIL